MQRGSLATVPKYQLVYEALRDDIVSGRLAPGARVPSEADLGVRFGASRITVGRAVRDLQVEGLVERRVGAGTFVRAAHAAPARASASEACTFGVLVPDLPDIEIFESLVQGLLMADDARPHAFVWGGGDAAGGRRAEAARVRVQEFIARGVDGVFFAPLEGLSSDDDTNAAIVGALDAAGIPVVLLDRAVHPYPRRGPYDLVGIDNRRVGYTATAHLLDAGARRLAFYGDAQGPSTIAARRAGFREALEAYGAETSLSQVPLPDPANRSALAEFLATWRPDGIVCAHDRGAARLMHALLALGVAIPEQVRLIGVDDVEYASWLPVPLTTVRQPVRQIGAAAIAAMIERRAHPERPARDIFVQCRLVVRDSCGASTAAASGRAPRG